VTAAPISSACRRSPRSSSGSPASRIRDRHARCRGCGRGCSRRPPSDFSNSAWGCCRNTRSGPRPPPPYAQPAATPGRVPPRSGRCVLVGTRTVRPANPPRRLAPIPGGIVGCVSLSSPTTAAFPALNTCRLPRRCFRGLNGVHWSSGLLLAELPKGSPHIEGFGEFVTSFAAPIATGWSDVCRAGIAPR